MSLLMQLCLATLLLGVATVHSFTTPLILENQDETPLILQENGIREVPVSEQLSPEELLEMMRERHFEMFNPTHVDGEELVEGDMLLNPEQKKLLAERKAIPTLSYRWPNGPAGKPLVPYMFNDTMVNQTAVMAAINHWQANTCIQFTPATNFSAPHLRFYNGSGCSSPVGKQNSAGQYVSLGAGCAGLGTVAHEIGHSLGFYHEQSRSDRDSYVVINTANIIPSYGNNFLVSVDNNYSVPYDYSSDMHYGSYYFTNNGYPTIATKDFFAQQLIGQRIGLSHRDKLLANRMYPCISSWLTSCGLASDPCLNMGYTGVNCTCVCPPGTTGSRCETTTGGYYDNLLTTCAQNVTTAGTITSPNYPNVYPAGLSCVKVIKAPPCYSVQLKFNSFQLYGQNPYCNNNMCCYFDSLEIRTTDPYNGTLFCSNMISPNQTFTSNTGQMILVFNTATNYYSGWSANVSFIYNSSCVTPVASSTTTNTASTTTTTTLSTTTTPTTTTPTTTTTNAPILGCGLAQLPSGAIQWTSPGFGSQNYPNNIMCKLNISCGSTPSWMSVQMNPFKLENMTGSVCNDYVTFSRFYNLANITYCGTQNIVFNMSSCNVYGMFLTNNVNNSAGFNITFTPKSSSCHQKLTLGAAGSTGTLSTPTPSQSWEKTGCEWWLQSPAGTFISMQFVSGALSGNCNTTSIIINGSGARGYPLATSKQYCGTALPATYTSTTNMLNMMYYSTNLNSPLSVKYTVVSAAG